MENSAIPCASACNSGPFLATNQMVKPNDDSHRRQRFDSIVAESRDRLGRIARVYGASEAEDLLQEIMLQIWRSLPSFSQKSKTSTWCYRIALNTAITWKRNRTRSKRLPPKNRVTTDMLESQTNFSNEAKLLHRFLETLSEVDRAVLLMYLDDLTTAEIADSIGASCGAIRTRISRIRSRLENWETTDGGS